MAGGYNGEADPFILNASRYGGASPQMLALALQEGQNADALQQVNAAGANSKSLAGAGLNLLASELRASHQKDLAAQMASAAKAQQDKYDAVRAAQAGVSPTPAAAAPTQTIQAATPAPPTSDGTIRGDLQQGFAAQGQPSDSGQPQTARNASVQIGPLSHTPVTPDGGDQSALVGPDGEIMPEPQAASPSATAIDNGAALEPQAVGQGPMSPSTYMASGGGGLGVGPQAQALAQALQGGGAQTAAPGAPSTQVQAQAAPPNPYSQGSPGFSGPASAVSPQSGPPVSPTDRDALIRMVYGEARGEPPQGQAATAAVALNRSIMSGQPVSQIVNAPGQFEGMKVGASLDPNSAEYQRIAAVVDPLLSGGQPDPSGGATHFYAPGAQAALGRQPPAWDDGTGRQIGNQLFFNKPFGGQQGMPPGSFQVAQNGGQISMPSNAAAQLPPQSGPQGAPQAALKPEYGPAATPQETALIQAYMASGVPALREQAEGLMDRIIARRNSQIEMDARFNPETGQTTWVPKQPGVGYQQVQGPPQGWRPPLAAGLQYGSNGQAQAIPGTAARPLLGAERAAYGISPQDGASYTVTPDGKVSKVADGVFQPLPQGQRSAYGIAPADRSAYAVGPDGKPVQTASDPFGPDKQVQYASTFMGLPQVKDYNQLRQFHDAAQLAAKQQGGPADLQILDMALKSNNPTLGIRPNQVDQMMSELGLPNQFKGEVQGLVQNGGKLSPAARSAMLNVIDNQMSASWKAVQPLMTKANRDAQKFGLTTDDLIPGLTPPPSPGSSGSGFGPSAGQQGGGPDVAASLANARAAIQRNPGSRAVVIQRLQAAGINPGAL